MKDESANSLTLRGRICSFIVAFLLAFVVFWYTDWTGYSEYLIGIIATISAALVQVDYIFPELSPTHKEGLKYAGSNFVLVAAILFFTSGIFESLWMTFFIALIFAAIVICLQICTSYKNRKSD